MNNLKTTTLALLILTSLSLSAKDYVVGFNGKITNDHFGPKIKVVKIYDTLDLAIIDAANEEDLAYLKLDPQIDFVDASITYKAPEKLISKPIKTLNKSAKVVKEKTPYGISLVKATKAWSYTQGEDVRVLVLDSGIDQNHPALKGAFEKGKNFMPGESSTNFKDNNGHGTHVSGTIAGSNTIFGVAPKVKILMAKVCDNGCPTMSILDGVEWGINEKVNVMNLSLGGGFPSAFAERVYKKAEDNNIVVVAASGNDGEYKSSYPASYSEVLSVGAVDSEMNIASFSNWSDELDVVAPGVKVYSSVPQGSGREAVGSIISSSGVIKLTELAPMAGTGVDYQYGLEVVYANLGAESDFENIDVRGKLALIKRGELTFKEKYDNAIAAGAKAVIVFNNVADPANGTLGENVNVEKIATTLDMKTGEEILKLLNSGLKVSAHIGVMATDYQYMNGTSMATPHTSGVVSLIRSINPKLNAKEVKALLKSTAFKVKTTTPEKFASGLIDALNAVEKARTL